MHSNAIAKQMAPAALWAPGGQNRTIYRVLLLAVVVLTVAATPVHAQPFSVEADQAFSEAEAWWGRQPEGCSSITKELVAPGSLDDAEGSHAGEATVPPKAELPPGFLPIPANLPKVPCEVWIVEGLTRVSLCSVMRHEYGHLLGYQHSDPAMAQLPPCQPSQSELATQREALEAQRATAWANWRERRRFCSHLPSKPPSWLWERRYCWERSHRSRERIEAYWAEVDYTATRK